MGGKKKTKWRKLPPEELSHITIKRREENKSKSNGSCKTGENNVQYSSNGSNGETKSGGRSCDFSDVNNTSDESSENMYMTDSGEPNEQSGFFINGLWVPVSQVQNTDCVNQLLPDVFRTLPLIMHQSSSSSSSSASSSAYPGFHTFHAPEVPFQSNFFIPNNNHYFYYLTRHQTKIANAQTTEQSNFYQNAADCSSYDISSGSVGISTDYISTSEIQATAGNTTSDTRYENTIAENQTYQCIEDQTYATNLSFEVPENVRTPYQYPGYGFGQPMYNAPLYVIFPSVQSTAYSNSSWSEVHLKRRKRRRKGYAEYAIVPKKKNSPQNSVDKARIAYDNSVRDNLEENKLDTKETNFCKNSTSLQNSDKGGRHLVSTNENQKKTTELVDTEVNKNFVSCSVKKEVVIYVSNLVENIIQQGIKKFLINCNLSSKTLKADFDISILKVSKDIESAGICRKISRKTCTFNEIIEEPKTIPDSGVDNKCVQAINLAFEQQKRSSLKNSESPVSIIGDSLLNKSTSIKLNEEYLKHRSLSTNSHDSLKYPAFSSLNVENNILLESALKMGDSDVQNRNENIMYNEKPKSENHVALETKGKLQNIHHFSVTHDNDDYAAIESKNETLGDFAVQSRYNPKVYDKSRASSNIAYNASKQRINFSETPGKTNTAENNHVPTPSSASNNEHRENEYNAESPSSQCNFVPHSMSSEVLIRETELELKKLHQLTSNSNQAIYKLAYDENTTDDTSETEDLDVRRSPHKGEPICPQSCKNLQPEVCRTEIIVHEMDSESDAGSEDVELIPHRYESDTAKGCNKHVYVNNLSLAVELLRTRESLPYDDEFKMIVNDDVENQSEAKSAQNTGSKPTLGKVNKGFIEDLSPISKVHGRSIDTHDYQKNSHKGHFNLSQVNAIVKDEPHHNALRHSIADSGVQSEESEDDIGEEIKDNLKKPNETVNSGDANFRRFGIQTRQRFNIYAPRSNVMNPCFCCVIM